jgi:hypothetical protein
MTYNHRGTLTHGVPRTPVLTLARPLVSRQPRPDAHDNAVCGTGGPLGLSSRCVNDRATRATLPAVPICIWWLLVETGKSGSARWKNP